MILRKIVVLASVAVALSAFAGGCQTGGVGDPCTPEDEYQPAFSGFAPGEVNVESRSFQCETRVCLVNHFRGRVSCPLGQDSYLATLADRYTKARIKDKNTILRTYVADYLAEKADVNNVAGAKDAKNRSTDEIINQLCFVPGSTGDSPELVTTNVVPQCADRTGDGDNKAVYCSCRCDGDDKDAQYCECPSGYACTKFPELDLGVQVAKAGTGLTGSYCVRDQDINPANKLVNYDTSTSACTAPSTFEQTVSNKCDTSGNCNGRTNNRL
ncbi:MAG: hypothetical protein EOO74_01295 [Myxococcales bacterium]|nr:MAG: hypothetical protein EOO74_01295 [Myxococcales bacterium]